MRSFALSDKEFLWRGFIVDLNAQEMLPVFKRLHLKAAVTAYGDDAATVHEAWDHYRTIVTANEAHFIRYMLEHQKRDSGTTCQDCWGLLVVPASAILRERLLPKVKNGIPVDGRIIPWRAAAYANLCISLHADGSIGVRRFRRCPHCEKDTPIKTDWYRGLPEIGSRTEGGAKLKPGGGIASSFKRTF
jgi:hypothetical protein